MNISVNPIATTTALGSFNTASSGLIQGNAYPDPATRFALVGGVLATTETLPMWGGIGVYEDVPGASGGPVFQLGPVVGRATALGGSKALLGWSVFDQAYGAVQSTSSPVPTMSASMQVMYYRIGSGARIAVAADPALVSLRGGLTNANVSWDFVNQLLIPYVGTLTVSSGTYNSTTGVVTLTMSAPITFSAGDDILPALTGTGSVANLNVNTTAIAPTSGTTVTFQAATGLTLTITGGTLTLGSGASVAAPVKVLDVQTTNCMTVNWDGTNATWNRNGCAAVILI